MVVPDNGNNDPGVIICARGLSQMTLSFQMNDPSGQNNDRISSQPLVATMDLDVSEEHR